MKRETQSFYEAAVRRAVLRIADSLDEALDLDALSRQAALSSFHFHRIFRGMLGETALELHRRLRMERAAHVLSGSDAPVTRVAFEAGYETHESFTRAFSDHFGLSPSAFRRACNEARSVDGLAPAIELAVPSGIHFRPGLPPELPASLMQGDPAMQVELKDRPATRLAAVHHRGPYLKIAEAFQRLGEIVGPAGLVQPARTEMLAIFHDDADTTAQDDLRSEAAVTVDEDARLPPGLDEIRIPASRYACFTHIGPYSELGGAWSRLLGAWLPRSGHRLADGPSFEVYRNTPMDVPPEQLRTEIYVPISP